MKTIDEREMQKTTKEKQTKAESKLQTINFIIIRNYKCQLDVLILII